MKHVIPELDLSVFEAATDAGRARLAAGVDDACRQCGFLFISGHGVPAALSDAMWEVTKQFFALPEARKLDVISPVPGGPYGYQRLGSEYLARSRDGVPDTDTEQQPDRKETFSCGPFRAPGADPEETAFCFAPVPWPEQPEAFRSTWHAWYIAMEQLAARIMTVFAHALTLPSGYFREFFTAPVSALRALNYPAVGTGRQESSVRAGAHSDYGTLTILLPQAGGAGLQVLAPDGSWVDVMAPPGAFVINIGDLMARWTNGRWASTVHRVVREAGCDHDTPRQSLAFFQQPDWNAEIVPFSSCVTPDRPAAFGPVRSGRYLRDKFRSTQPSQT
ncbi:isopenicillin N synthase family oxygenase [Acetobacter musti]|uniref:2-oxoglutarate-dependent ethylene/succinate-forming enzyme n=1 Tax=Acetobacter musti TaxID=864732 RepID=A0ABX0JN19_9PROT|nr:isopenicillin N synthase family oxygenase [Acetobacter musti]NHN84803.1 isopenicillin N synthase family oxygenase [Acetobacter musti]